MIGYNTAVVLAGTSLLGANAGLIGSFAVLRRRALLGDTLAHAALPGLCLGFLALGHRSLPAMLAGALASGVTGIAIVAVLRRFTRIKDDAALGIVLSLSFGLGLALLRWIQTSATGGSKSGIANYIFGTAAGMIADDVKLIAGVSLFSLLAVLLFYKEFRLVTFDAGFARVQGWPATLLDFLVMALVAASVIVGLPAVGVVLTAALLILPAAAARLWTERLGFMLLLAAVFGAAIGASGTAFSVGMGGLPTGPLIVLTGAAVFLFSLLFANRRGVVARLAAERNMRQRVAEQTLLRVMFEFSEADLPARPPVAAAALARSCAWSPAELERQLRRAVALSWLEPMATGAWRFTSSGLDQATRVARGYRLWRALLTEQPEAASLMSELDLEAIDRMLPAETVRELEAKMKL
ncbi:MAG TPA: metal ABC transporter permease [Pirellulales bacterium]|nr:metal ABC transporter permease [Pirellulales bacterium]